MHKMDFFIGDVCHGLIWRQNASTTALVFIDGSWSKGEKGDICMFDLLRAYSDSSGALQVP